MNTFYSQLREYAETVPVIDTHEHLPPFEKFREIETDFLKEYLSQYFISDLISAGLSKDNLQKARDISIPIIERWKIVEPYWNYCRKTGYGRLLDITVKELYDFDKICYETIEGLQEAFSKTLTTGRYDYILKEKSKIEISILSSIEDFDRDYFRGSYRVDFITSPTSIHNIQKLEQDSGIKIRSFDDYLDAVEKVILEALQNGYVALKCGLAYKRSLHFKRSTKAEAENDFKNIFENPNFLNVRTGRKFEDYLFRFILNCAAKIGLPMQLHTGLQAGNGNHIANSEPSLLTNLFIEYPEISFDIFHIAYPYQNVLAAIAKNFPNVYIDMCWAHIISPNASVTFLRELIDTVPFNKISAFGGDHSFIDAVYGHLVMAKDNVCRALSDAADDGVLDMDEAKLYIRKFFYDNPRKLFRLDEKN